MEEVLAASIVDDIAEAASQIGSEPKNGHQSEHDDDHLDEVRHGNRPHPANHRISEHDSGTDDHACRHGHRAFGDQIDHQAQCRYLSTDPTEIRNHNGNRASSRQA